jgi:Na+-transporting methylmalonyl-CoA/oxaloacetate decarboxylase gamma subunit
MSLAVTVTGAPAILIILVILALLITGVIVAIRAAGRGVKKGVDHVADRRDEPADR